MRKFDPYDPVRFMLNEILKSVAFWMSFPTGLLGLLAGAMGGATRFEFGLLFVGGCFAGLGSWALLREVGRGYRYPYVGLVIAAVIGTLVSMIEPWPLVLAQFAMVIGVVGFTVVRALWNEWQTHRERHAEPA